MPFRGEDSPPPIPDRPDGVPPDGWVRTAAFGTDGYRTWTVDVTGWHLLVDAHVRITVERSAAPDPDFPDRAEDGDDAGLESTSDVQVTTRRGSAVRTRMYRGVRTSQLRKLTPLDQYGPSAWRGADVSTNGKARLFRAVVDLSDAYGLPSCDFYSVTGWHPTDRKSVV